MRYYFFVLVEVDESGSIVGDVYHEIMGKGFSSACGVEERIGHSLSVEPFTVLGKNDLSCCEKCEESLLVESILK